MFSTAVMGMFSQARTMSDIGTNIANVNTGGYKRVETHFSSLVSDTFQHEGDLGGIRTKQYNRIASQGTITASDRDLDLAINGAGFFVLNSKADGSGDTYYGRDGSFHQESGETATAVDLNGNTITYKKGYLADKNGYFVQGWEADINGNFSPALKPIRIDTYAYYDAPISTTGANVHINIPADAATGATFKYSGAVYDSLGETQAVTFNFTKTDVENEWTVNGSYYGPPTAQVDTATLAGTIEAGDVYSMTVNGTAVSYTALGTEADIGGVRDGLLAAIAADPTVGAIVTAAPGAALGEITLTAVTAGTQFTATSSATNGGVTADNTLITTTTTANLTQTPGTTADATFVFDGEGQLLDIRKGAAQAQVNTLTMAAGQKDTLTLTGTAGEAGDTYSATVNGTTVTYTTTGGEANINAIRDGLLAAINADVTVGALVTASPGAGPGELLLTSVTAGATFTTTVAAADGGGTADNNLTVTTGNTIEAGDVYSATVSGTTVTYTALGTEADIGVVRDALLAAINADGTLGPLVTAAPGAGLGEIALTADTPGSAFSVNLDTTNGGAFSDNQFTHVAHTPNRLNIPSPNDSTSLTYSVTWANGATSTTTFDFTDTTQFASDELVPLYYHRNGNASGQLERITFDTFGVAIGSFSNGTSRPLYKVPLAEFVNPELLSVYDGNVYRANNLTSTPSLVSASLDGYATFTPNARELSNVDIADEFSRIIMTQNAYNSSATVFKSVDEMLTTAKDLIR
ncbi:flagellar hook-basal body complex protein [Magnetospira thiophila]